MIIHALDEYVRHQIGLQRLCLTIIDRAVRRLGGVQVGLAGIVADRVARVDERGALLGFRNAGRVQALIDHVAEVLGEAHKALRTDLTDELVIAGRYEMEWLARFYAQVPGGSDNKPAVPTTALLRSIVTARPFLGATLNNWAASMERAQRERIARHIRMGLTDGEPVDAIVRRLSGRSGQFARDKTGLETLVRTAFNHTVNRAHEALVEPVSKDFGRFTWVTFLDAASTSPCRKRTGHIYVAGGGTVPPVHWRCRAGILFMPAGEKKAPDLPSFADWFSRQDVPTQDDIIGQRAGVQYRKGKVAVTRYTDRQAAALTLDELKRQDDAAWRKAFDTAE